MVDDGHGNRPFSLQVCQVPARAAVRGAPFDVVCAANIWEVGEILEIRVTTGEIGASNVLGFSVLFVVIAVPRDSILDNREGVLALLGVFIREVVKLLGRGDVATCGRRTSDVREEECEDKCSDSSEVDHSENAGV